MVDALPSEPPGKSGDLTRKSEKLAEAPRHSAPKGQQGSRHTLAQSRPAL